MNNIIITITFKLDLQIIKYLKGTEGMTAALILIFKFVPTERLEMATIANDDK